MNEDIVKRMRRQLDAPASVMGGESCILNPADVREAVDEIERLRAELREWQDAARYASGIRCGSG
jgi:hypothetical protein